jgi:hypothetical protein
MTSAGDQKPMSRTAAILYAIGLPLALVVLVFLPAGAYRDDANGL